MSEVRAVQTGRVGSVVTDDGVSLHVEAVGAGPPVLFIHEFAGDLRSWQPQVDHFASTHRCVLYNARGYPPSAVPAEAECYSQERAAHDARAVLDGLDIERAHVVGLSMGGFCALHLAMNDPDRVRSLVVAGCGYGAAPDAREAFRAESAAIAAAFEHEGAAAVAERYARGPARVQFRRKDPAGWLNFKGQLAEHSARGLSRTMLGVQRERPSLYDLRGRLAAIRCPVLIINGDEDDGCLEAGLMLKRTIPAAGLAVLPNTGHTSNLEEPQAFNAAVTEFLSAAEEGTWPVRDPATQSGGLTGMADAGR